MSETSILLVDDEEFYLRLYADFLDSPRFRVVGAGGGRHALALLQRERFDILITDLLMPDLDGLQLVEQVRRNFPWVDIIVVTQRDDVRLAVKSMRMGVFEYLVKPVERDELILAIDRLLERRRLIERQDKLLDESMEYLQGQAVYRRCLEIMSTLDLDNLCQMILSHMQAATNAQGAILWLAAPGSDVPASKETLNLAAYRGLVTLEDYPPVITASGGPRGLSECLGKGTPAILPAGTLSSGNGGGGSDVLVAPLRADGNLLGIVALLDKLKQRFGERDAAVAGTMAQFSAIAVGNARRFQALERFGLRDQKSSAYNLTYFIDYAGKEIYKARRYGRVFSLAVVTLDRFDFLREHFKPEVHQQLSMKLAENLTRVVRDSDVLARVADNQFYALLPETDGLGARHFCRRCREAFYTDAYVQRFSEQVPVQLSAAMAAFPLDGKDFDQLLSVCRKRAEQSRMSLFWRMGLEKLDFWQMVSRLVGRDEDYEVPIAKASTEFRMSQDQNGRTGHAVFDDALFEQLELELLRLVAHSLKQRAVVYDVGGRLGDSPRGCERLASESDRLRVTVIGVRDGEDVRMADHPAVTRVFTRGERALRHRLLLVLGEQVAYALLARRTDGDRLIGFHGSDQFLVECLVERLQEHYSLQRRY
ncbi:MAG: response regulator [Deltaproteobacteria bacterium]|nr:MAG: response regulator [Deltaproteobacteria bacterium]